VSRARLGVLAVALAAAGGIALGLIIHAVAGSARGGLELPAMHGQASWEAGERRAPPFSLRDQDGIPVSLAVQRGRPVLLTFLDFRCHDQCPLAGRELGTMLRGMSLAWGVPRAGGPRQTTPAAPCWPDRSGGQPQ
jgi:cytochrome oxidase Cu insertion factor (SCO1/SenC/PrrC family)